MTYVAQQNTALQNLTALANLAHPFTKEYQDATDAKNREFFVTKLNACQISAVCLAVLGIVTAVAASVAAGVIVGSLVVIPVGLYMIVKSKSAEYDQALVPNARIVNDIALQVATYVQLKRIERLQTIINASPGKEISAYTREDVEKVAMACLTNFVQGTLSTVKAELMQEHVQLFNLAHAVASRAFAANDVMLQVQEACTKYVSYNKGLHITHNGYHGTYSAYILSPVVVDKAW